MNFMTHPEHGAHYALDGDVEPMKKQGWKISTPEEWVSEKSVVQPDENVVTEPKKRGPKPKVK